MIIFFLAFLAFLYNFYYVFYWCKVEKFSTKIYLVSLVFTVEAAIVRFLLPDPYSFMLKNVKVHNTSTIMTTYPLVPPPFRIENISTNRKNIKNDLIPFLENIICNYTNPLDCKQEPHTITSFLLTSEHLDSYLYYI